MGTARRLKNAFAWLAATALVAGLVSACGPAAEPAPAAPAAYDGPPRPALWKIADADTTIYLFGTIHLLPPALDWETPAFKAAFGEASTVYFEADTDIPPAEIGAIVQRTGILPPADNLSDRLDPGQREALRAAAARFGLSSAALDRMRPWYASVVISDAAIRKAGFDSGSGVENVLRPAAIGAGKALRFLETVEAQLSAYTILPDAVQVRLLDASLKDLDKAGEMLTGMISAWRAGDDKALTARVIDDQLATQPEIYQTLMVRRNAAWAPQLDAIMRNESGVFLVAVGAGHLLGPDSVLKLLEPLGYTPVRVQ